MAGVEYDVVVLGARVAGATLATLLGQAGVRVLLVDRATFPSPTLSTHYFRGGRGVTTLKHLGVLDSVLALGCPPLSCQYVYHDGGGDGVIQPAQQPGEAPYCLSVRRVSLQEEERGHRGVYYCYVRGFPGPRGAPDGPEFSRIGDEQAYVFPSESGITCLALSLNLTDFAWMRRQPERRFRERMVQHHGLAERFSAAAWEGSILGCGPHPNYVRVPYGPGWALVGDAGLHQDPWSGHGMDNAGVHAAFLAEALQDWLSGAAAERDALGRYHQRRDADSLDTYHRTVVISRDMRQQLAA